MACRAFAGGPAEANREPPVGGTRADTASSLEGFRQEDGNERPEGICGQRLTPVAGRRPALSSGPATAAKDKYEAPHDLRIVAEARGACQATGQFCLTTNEIFPARPAGAVVLVALFCLQRQRITCPLPSYPRPAPS